MSQEDGEHSVDRLEGLSLDEAVEVVASEGSRDPDDVRRALSYVTDEDDVVTTEAVEEAQAYLSKVVSTPETRTELAEIALSDARAAAEPVADLDIVRARLSGYEGRLDEIQAHVPTLGDDLQSAVDTDGKGIHEVAVEIQQLTEAANSAQQAADELSVDLEEFERWLSNSQVRYDAFADEVDALEGSLDDLAESVETAAEALEVAPETHVTLNADPVATWVDLSLRHRVVELLFADLRAELTSLREWPDTETDERAAELDARLDALRTRWEDVGDRLDAVGPDEHHYEDVLASLEDALDAYEPLVDWNEVQETLDEHRSQVDGLV